MATIISKLTSSNNIRGYCFTIESKIDSQPVIFEIEVSKEIFDNINKELL